MKVRTSRSITALGPAKLSVSRAAIASSSPPPAISRAAPPPDPRPDRRGRRVERKDLLGASLEKHTAEFFLAELDELGQSHSDRTSGTPTTTGSRFTPLITER